MFILLLTAKAKSLSSGLTKVAFLFLQTYNIGMIWNLQPNYVSLIPTKLLSFSIAMLGSAIHLHVVAWVSRSHSINVHKRARCPGKIRRIISICKWIHRILLKDLDGINYKNFCFFSPSLNCFCITHIGQYMFIHLRYKGKVSILCIVIVYSVNIQFCLSTWDTGKIEFCAYKKSRKPYQKARQVCDWQFFHVKNVWKSEQPRDATQTLLNGFKRNS